MYFYELIAHKHNYLSHCFEVCSVLLCCVMLCVLFTAALCAESPRQISHVKDKKNNFES